MSLMMKIGLFAVAAVFVALPLRKENGISLLLAIAASTIIFLYALSQLQTVVDFLSALMEKLPVEQEYLRALFKMLGIIYIADFTSNICREAGFASLGNEVEIFAKLSIIAFSIPVLRFLTEILESFF